MAYLSDLLKSFNDLPGLIGFTSVLLLLYQCAPIRRIGAWIAPFSYELYLVHIAVLGTVFYFLHPTGVAAQLLAGFLGLALSRAAAKLYSGLLKKY